MHNTLPSLRTLSEGAVVLARDCCVTGMEMVVHLRVQRCAFPTFSPRSMLILSTLAIYIDTFVSSSMSAPPA